MSDKINMDKIIILSECELWWKDSLKTVAIKMHGMRVDGLLYINDMNSMPDKEALGSDLLNEIYDDCYDADDIDVVLTEVYNGEHAMIELANFIYDSWSPETMVLFFEPNQDSFGCLARKLEEIDGNIYISEYHDIFKDKKDTEKDIYEIMKYLGIRVEHMIKDSYISKGYFLGALVDILHSR